MEHLDWDLIVENTARKQRALRRLREIVDEDHAIEARFWRSWLGEELEMQPDPYSQTQIAKASRVHHVTVAKFLRGEPVRSDAERRLKKTMKKLGVVDLAELGEPNV